MAKMKFTDLSENYQKFKEKNKKQKAKKLKKTEVICFMDDMMECMLNLQEQQTFNDIKQKELLKRIEKLEAYIKELETKSSSKPVELPKTENISAKPVAEQSIVKKLPVKQDQEEKIRQETNKMVSAFSSRHIPISKEESRQLVESGVTASSLQQDIDRISKMPSETKGEKKKRSAEKNKLISEIIAKK